MNGGNPATGDSKRSVDPGQSVGTATSGRAVRGRKIASSSRSQVLGGNSVPHFAHEADFTLSAKRLFLKAVIGEGDSSFRLLRRLHSE